LSLPTLNDAPVGHTLAQVGDLLAEAERLCRAVAPRDLGETPLYVVPQSSLPAECGGGEYCYAYTTPSLDLYLRDHIPGYRGRGPCIVVNDLALAEEFAGASLAYRIKTILLHELAHVLERPAVYEDRTGVSPNKIKFEALVVAHVTSAPPREEIPPYHGHEAGFIRVCVHLCHRARQIGFDVNPGAICAGYTYCLSVAQRYQKALGDEPERCMGMPFRDILATRPPAAFTQLWTSDFFQYQRLTQPRGGK
jgi:hypothetical protein